MDGRNSLAYTERVERVERVAAPFPMIGIFNLIKHMPGSEQSILIEKILINAMHVPNALIASSQDFPMIENSRSYNLWYGIVVAVRGPCG